MEKSERERARRGVYYACSRALRTKDDVQARVRTISVLAVLLQGPFDTGNAILGSQNLVELMLQMADSGDLLQEVVRRVRKDGAGDVAFHL